MKHIKKTERYIHNSSLTEDIFQENCIFFDIETTGFSPASSICYLIGALRKDGDMLIIDQFLAETKRDEETILLSFLEILKGKTCIITFNGLGFDIPFIESRCKAYGIPSMLNRFQYVDIYKNVCAYKFLFKLQNHKQKTIEHFLGISRDDKYSGGELIEVFEKYTLTKDSSLEELLLLHNFEDVKGMLDLLPILTYGEILKGAFTISQAELLSYTSFEGKTEQELIIKIHTHYAVPKPVSCQMDDFYLTLNGNIGKLRVPIYKGTLKYFYPNYKDYYYLPREDMAIHKSVAEYVDKEYRQKAKACNCYSRKEGEFLPQFDAFITPLFLKEHKDKISYFELTEEFLSSNDKIKTYVDHLISHL